MYDVVYIFRGILIGLMVSGPLGPRGVLIRIRDQCHTDSRVDPTDHRGNFSDYRRIENLFR